MNFEVCGFENLHRHTSHGSLLDGQATVDEYCERSKQINQLYLSVTDHGMMTAIPAQIRACDEYNLTPIFGQEGYLNDMQPTNIDPADYKKFVDALSPEEALKIKKSYHILLLAYSSDVGYPNLVQLSSLGWQKGYGGLPRRPRITHEQLHKHKDGLICTSGCYLSEIGQAFETGGDDAALEMIKKYYDIFQENFYLEMMLLDFKKQKPYNAFLVRAHDKTHIPMVITCDCHYCAKESAKFQRYMLMVRTKRTVQDIEAAIANKEDTESFFELQDTNLWMKSEDEINEKWLSDYSDVIPYEVLCEAKRNTVRICEKAKGVKIDRSIKLPKIPDAEEKLKDAIRQGVKWRGITDRRYLMQLKKEYDLVCRKDFASYFLIQKMFVDEARRVCPSILGYGDGSEALAPGRGSAVSFLLAYTLGITGIDPIKHELIPERFLSDNRGGKQMKLRFQNAPMIAE